ncbi:SOUL family heme-binding protein [Sphingomonas xanthus]|uniref:Heme-binding protein n=1 Tax=Sphingomonas xanthus TaxID=2594473 RepID=A0A516IUF8_9SPHN|nr:heme-binding protein [Sphingomonas xanthus]QDP20548.1 heme-binding protein [Sphingomonas xanthus]
MRKDMMAGAAAAVGAALLGGAYYLFREKQTPEPDYRTLLTDGDYQLRDYPAMVVAETVVHGPRRDALSQGFRILADYIFAKSRGGQKLPMTVPVIQDGGDPMASDPPLFNDALEGAWRTRFVMLRDRAELPQPPDGVELVKVPARKIAVVSFAGRGGDKLLADQEDRLRGWLARNGEKSDGEPEYAFYNSPMIPGPLRRNEVWLPIG